MNHTNIEDILKVAQEFEKLRGNDFSGFNEVASIGTSHYVKSFKYQIMRMFNNPIEQIEKIIKSNEPCMDFPQTIKGFNKIFRYFLSIKNLALIDFNKNIRKIPEEVFRAVNYEELQEYLNGNGTIESLCSVSKDKQSILDFYAQSIAAKHAIIVFKFKENIPHVDVNPTLANFDKKTLNAYGNENEIIIAGKFKVVSIKKIEGSYPTTYIAEVKPINFNKSKNNLSFEILAQKYAEICKSLAENAGKINSALNKKISIDQLKADHDFMKWCDDLKDFTELMEQAISQRIINHINNPVENKPPMIPRLSELTM